MIRNDTTMTTDPIYMDHAASTPVDPHVVEAMLPYFNQAYGNPSSVHSFGQQAEDAIEAARRDIAAVLNCHPNEVVFTSCATESNNLALRGTAWQARHEGKPVHIITTPVEHPAVSKTGQQLRDVFHAEVTVVPVDKYGMVDPDDIRAAIRPTTTLISVMTANNESGVLQPISELSKITRRRGVLFHTDAVQALGKITLDVDVLGVDLLTISAHKIFGPKGVGALYTRKGIPLEPLIDGGSQEYGRRAGTENTLGIVGFGTAADRAMNRLSQMSNVRQMRDRLESGVLEIVPNSHRNGHAEHRLPNTSNITLPGIRGESLVIALDQQGIEISSGSACRSGSPQPSHALLALGLSEEQAHCSVRFSLGPDNTAEEIDRTLACIRQTIEEREVLVRFVSCR